MVSEPNTDPDFDNAFLSRAAEASQRWHARTSIREARTKAVEENRPLDADSRARLALRLNRLISDVRLSSRDRRGPDNPTLRSLMARTTPLASEDLNAELVQEVVLGARNFMSVEFLGRGSQAARRVGRIRIQSGGSMRARGTGFLVGRGMVLTNEHVLRSREQAATCSIQMDYEQNRFAPNPQPQTFAFEPDRFFLNNHDLDFALVAVAARSNLGSAIDDYGWLTLNAAQGKIVINSDDYVNVVQHPLGREKEVVVRDNRLLDLGINDQEPVPLGPFLHYEADTEKGSSGSPVLNDQWEVVALHHTAVPVEDANGKWLDKQGNVWNRDTQSVEDIAWHANEGVRVSSLVAELSKASVPPAQRALLDQVLATQAPPVPVRAPSPREGLDDQSGKRDEQPRRSPAPGSEVVRPKEEVAMRRGTEFEVPLRISITVGDPVVPGKELGGVRAAATANSIRSELLEEALSPEDYADREGYDRRFLGVNVPFPTMKANPRFGGVLAVPRPARPRDTKELRYHRFSVIMNKKRRLAYVSACNVNFDPPASVSRDEGSQSWRRDPRIDPENQLGAPYYDQNEYDKGHLTRRDDGAWGSDKEDALAANRDTFHYTNAAPQHELFNRSTDFTGAKLDLWGDLENFISEQGDEQRAHLSIFNGPIFGGDDKKLSDALVPWSFFKIVIWRDKNQTPGAVGFVLEQRDLIKDLPEEAIDPGRFSIRQKRISRIERDLDISFGPVTEWDRMPVTDANESLEEDGIEISSVTDIAIQDRKSRSKPSRK